MRKISGSQLDFVENSFLGSTWIKSCCLRYSKISAFRNTFNKVDVDGSGEINMQVCSTP